MLAMTILWGAMAKAADYQSCANVVEQLNGYMDYSEVRSNVRSAKVVLANEGLGEEWLWLMLAESGSSGCGAESHAGAKGAWQLMGATARHYGCDNVSDLECSTRAAARYIKHLLRMFDGDIQKAIYGYNMGGRNYKRLGKPTREASGLAFAVMCGMDYGELRYE